MGRGFLWIALALLVLSSSVSAQPRAFDPEEAIRAVFATPDDPNHFVWRGTGFHVGAGIFYTNAHVVLGAPSGFTSWYVVSKSSSRNPGTWPGPFRVTCVHPKWQDGDPWRSSYDVAQLKMENKMENAPPLPSLAFHDSLPAIGDRVIVKGYPQDFRGWPPILHTATGRVFEIMPDIQIFRIQIESGLARGGSSGSPVLTEDGRVMGIVYGGASKRTEPAGVVAAVYATSALEGCPP